MHPLSPGAHLLLGELNGVRDGDPNGPDADHPATDDCGTDRGPDRGPDICTIHPSANGATDHHAADGARGDVWADTWADTWANSSADIDPNRWRRPVYRGHA